MPAQTFHTRCILTVLITLYSIGQLQANPLPNRVQSSLNRHQLDTEGLSIFIRELDTGQEVLSYLADTPRNPASAMKVLTGLAALETLAPGYRWTTRLYAEQDPVDGILGGDLYLVGGGDPYLVQERLWLMLQSLMRNGVSKVQGNLVIDDSLFAPIQEDTGAFDNQPFRVYNALPSAVLTNFNSNHFIFEPGPNRSVRILAVPELEALNIDNQLRTVDQACRGYRRGIAVSMQTQGKLRFDGKFPARCDRYGFTRSVLPPTIYTTSLFRKTWEDLGGEINGSIRQGSPAEDAVLLLEHDSVTLGEATRLMNKHSSNLIARHILLTMGGETYGWPATENKGIDAIKNWLETNDLDFPEMIIENGAGRSRKARISARHLVDIIETGWRSRYMPEFIASMALLGQDGTLGDRHASTPLNGLGHFKTGRLDHVTALAGVMHNRNGKRYALAILHNDTDIHRGIGEAVQDSVLSWLNDHKTSDTTDKL